MSTATAQVNITPEMLAQAFWGMESSQQVEFFRELAATIQRDLQGGNISAYSLGELQWHYVGHDLLKPENKQAREMLMTMAAPLYLHTLNYCERGAA